MTKALVWNTVVRYMAVLKDQAKMDSKIITIYIVDNIIPLYIIHREASILSVSYIESHFVYSTRTAELF